MKTTALAFLLSLVLLPTSWAAPASAITLKKVHLCCDSCVRGVEKSIQGIEGVTVKADKDAGTVTLESSDKRAVQKALNALAAGGYFGQSDKPELRPVAPNGTKGKTVQSVIVTGVHLCCGGCVKAIDRAVKQTPGATGHTAKKNAVTFEVTGSFIDQKFFEALQREGLNGRVTSHSAPEPAGSASDH